MTERRKRSIPSKGKSGSFTGKLLKAILIICPILLALLFIGLFLLKGWIESYRNSDAFREFLASKVAGALKAEAELASLRWEGNSVFADGFRAEGYEDASIAKLEVDGVRAVFGGAQESAWQVPEAFANRMNLEFSPRRLPGRHADLTPSGSGDDGGGDGVPGWLKPYLPTGFEIDVVKIDAANLGVKDADAVETFALRSVRSEILPAAGSGWDIRGQGGDLFIAGQPDLGIDRFRVRLQGPELFINEAEIDAYETARLSGTGSVAFAEGTPLDLDLQVSNLDVKHLLGPEWQDRVKGTLRGDIKLTGHATGGNGLRQEGTLHLVDGLLTDLPLLEKIADYSRSDRFRRLTLSQASGDFDRQGDRIVITNLKVQSDGLSRLEGSLVIDGRALDGNLRLGITPGTLQWIPGAEQKVFVTAEDGFLWTPVRLAGTLDEPSEDLTNRLIAGAVEKLVEDAPQKAIDTANEAIKNPTAAPGTLIDEGKKLIDTLVPLLGQ